MIWEVNRNMFIFLFKKTVKSPVLIISIIITSIFLLSDFMPYFQFFPIESEEDLIYMSNTGASGDFVKNIFLYDEETKIEKIVSFYNDILHNDLNLDHKEKEIIENKILKSKSYDEYLKGFTELFFYGANIGTHNKHQYYHDVLSNTSGENYLDVNKRIDDSLKNHRISEFFAMRFCDRVVIIWVFCTFAFITFTFSSLNNYRIKDILYPKAFKSSTFIFNNICIEIILLFAITFIQMIIFALLFCSHVKGVYDVNMFDFIKIYFIFVLPSIIVIVGILNFLYYVFDSPIIVFPIFYILQAFSSKVSPVYGYTINKTNFIIRYDTLFAPLSDIELNDLVFNRILMLIIFILLLPLMTYIFNLRRNGQVKFTVKLRRKNDKKEYKSI